MVSENVICYLHKDNFHFASDSDNLYECNDELMDRLETIDDINRFCICASVLQVRIYCQLTMDVQKNLSRFSRGRKKHKAFIFYRSI